ncbi:MAG: dihydropyrimidinase [Eubacteriales bacterium]|nr:dihydropyrimidinase [Eubacteriales bacterium]
MKTLIKGGTVITTENEFVADVLIEDEKIAAVGKDLSADGVDKVIDAAGKYVMPGGVDQHVHYSFVYKGSKVRGFETTDACALGGTTTVIEFVNQVKGKGLIESLEDYKKTDAEGISMIDYAFHPVMVDPRPEVIDEIPSLAEAGYPTMKLFMAYKGQFFHADDDAIIAALVKGKETGVTVMVHAENADMIDYLTKKLIAEGKTGAYYHAVSRPPIVEAEATSRAIMLAEMADAPIYIVHVTCKEALQAIKDAQQKGLPVCGETCAHYLLFDESVLALPNEEGAKYVCSPALRTPEHQPVLWEAIEKGWLNAISSDHCGFDWAVQKHLGMGEGCSFADIPNGAPSVQNRMNAIWTYGVCEGKISRQKFVEVMCTNPAKNNGLVNKGIIAAGYDADIVVFDPDYRGVMGVESCREGVDYSIYEGMEQKGRPETVLLRGKVIVEDAKYIGAKGDGKFVPGKPYGKAYDNVAK